MMKIKHFIVMALIAIITPILFSACKKDRNMDNGSGNFTPGPDVNFYALTSDGNLLYLNAKALNPVKDKVAITGLQMGETILSMDFRPSTGQLYGVGSTSRLYVINPTTGVARSISAAPFTPAISGTAVALDFNPTVDRIRLVTNTGQNLRLNPETGTVAATDGAINGVTGPKVSSVAYTQNRAGASSTVLFDIDVTTDKLYKQDPPNDGKLVEVGGLGIDADETGGFDISPDGAAALAAISSGSTSALYNIDLSTGKASKIKNFDSAVTAVAIPTEPVAYAVSNNNELLIFNPASATPSFVPKPITGLQTGENILGIDMRPANGQLYAFGSTSRIYTINASSGAAALVGTGPLSTLLTSTNIGFDFNPVPDRIRIIGDNGQNFRVNPLDASLTVDGNISLTTANVTGAAYTNNFAGTTTTVLYDIDSNGDRLYKQDPPNAGTLVDVGALGINVESNNGFDIGGTSGIAYGIFTVAGVQKLYTINLTTGAATAGATIATPVRGFTLGLGF